MIRWLWRTAALLTIFLIASCGCGGGGHAGDTPSERCGLPPDVGNTGSAPQADTGIGRDVRTYRPLDTSGR